MMPTFASSSGTICLRKYAYDPMRVTLPFDLRLWLPLGPGPAASSADELVHVVDDACPEIAVVLEGQNRGDLADRKRRRVDACVLGPFGAIHHPHQVVGDLADLSLRFVRRNSDRTDNLRADPGLLTHLTNGGLLERLAR